MKYHVNRDIAVEYQKIAKYLTIPLKSVLDIGAGRGDIDVYLAQRGDVKHIHLVDGDGTGEHVSGYSSRPTVPWRDVMTGVDFVTPRVPKDVKVTWSHPHTPWVDNFDLVVSLKSWGHHYPLSTYLDRVIAVQPKLILLDLRTRKGVCGDGIKQLRKVGFREVARVDETPRCARYLFKRRK